MFTASSSWPSSVVDSLDLKVHRTADGADVAYRLRGGKEPWVLLHGLGCDATLWDGVVVALPGEVGLLIPELRGHGDSTLGWRQPEVGLWARDVAEIIESESLERPAIAGLSMGGYTALAMAAVLPETARAWAFISTQAGPDDEAGRGRRAEGLATLCRRGWKSYAASIMTLLLSEENADYPRHRARLMKMFARAGEAGLAAALVALANRPDRRPSLPRLQSPSVVVVGDADLLAPPEKAREIVEAVPGSNLVLLPGVAHMSVLEAPAEVARALDGL